ncbi:GNAT family N-acetyltransferase [Amaricoccus tamworthensis]|uniref:GNAT family N-acetyltransferase n=1 Tax=Amaricoccus tamworthensis TaxID=57002 RepID=UPI003C7CD0AD
MTVIREVTGDDLLGMMEVRLSVEENHLSPEQLENDYGVTVETLSEGLRQGLRGWLAEVDGKAVAFCIGDGKTGEMQVVAVRPEYEDQGLGRAVLDPLCEWLFAQGHSHLWLLANPDPGIRASGFYERLGWKETGERRGPDIVMTLDRTDQMA